MGQGGREEGGLTGSFLLQRCTRVEDAQGMHKLLKVNHIIPLGVKVVKHLHRSEASMLLLPVLQGSS